MAVPKELFRVPISFLLIVFCGLAPITIRAEATEPTATTAPSAPEPVWEGASLTYKGDIVHPMALKEFAPWLSADAVCYQLDLEGALSTNRYPQKVTRLPDGSVHCQQDDTDTARGYVDYHVLGRLRGGTYVLMFSQNGGGSGVFQDLLFVRPISQTVQTADGRTITRSMLQLVDSHGLGDRYGGKIEIQDDQVTVGAYEYPRPERPNREEVLREPKIITTP